MIVYVDIGNSDDRLTQREWSDFIFAVQKIVDWTCFTLHGVRFSAPADPWQNASWCVGFADNPHGRSSALSLRAALARLAADFHQNSIAWNQVNETEFIRPPNEGDSST